MALTPAPPVRGVLRPISIAPMMERTDRHYRWFMRQITRHTLLYTEMVAAPAILHGDRDRLLGFDPAERPLALQLGGDDPGLLAECARIAEGWGYDELNLNVGCPSSRVQQGRFGACLMRTPERVAEAVEAMRQAAALPVTVKHRIGVDELDRYDDMARFVRIVAEAGADRFTVHARKAWLSGLSPKENRNVPPLRYGDVHRLKAELPHLSIEINGGIRSVETVRAHLDHVDAVMIGRAACDDPWLFAPVDRLLFGEDGPTRTREEVARAMIPYLARWSGPDHKIHRVTRHLLNLFVGQPGARAWKRALTEGARDAEAGPKVILQALEDRAAAQRPPVPLNRSSSSWNRKLNVVSEP